MAEPGRGTEGRPDAERLRELAADNERLFAELVAHQERFRSLARAAWQVEEAERRRLARELHDGVGQTLTALKILLERLAGAVAGAVPEEPDRLVGRLDEAVEIAASALAETRRISHRLRPGVLDDLGLGPALAWLARTVEEWAGTPVRLEAPEAAAEGLAKELESLVFRLVQEAVNNAVKHSGAEAVEVRLERTGPHLRVRVTDAGRGFDPAAPSRGSESLGLAGMRDRVEVLGGRFVVASAPGEGTRIEALLPVEGGGDRPPSTARAGGGDP